jgi:hypothetical protein
VLAITPIDCLDRCTLAVVIFPLVMVVLGFGGFLVAVAITTQVTQRALREPRPEGLTRADLVLAAQDGIVLAGLGLLTSRAIGLGLEAPDPLGLGIPPFIGSLASGWIGCFLILLGIRSRSPTSTSAFWPTIGTTATAAAAFPAVGAVCLLLMLGRGHGGPCIAPRPEPGTLAAIGAILSMAGSLVGRVLT